MPLTDLSKCISIYALIEFHLTLFSGTSDPKGPVYLWGRREAMEEEVPESLLEPAGGLKDWPSVEPSALSPTGTLHL